MRENNVVPFTFMHERILVWVTLLARSSFNV